MTPTPIDPRLSRLLGSTDTGRLRERLCHKLRLGQRLTGTVTLDRPTAAECDAIARLLGRRAGSQPAKLAINLKQVESTLVAAGLCTDLAEAVQQIEGPIHNERAQKDQATTAWDVMITQARQAGQDVSGNETWLSDLNQTGLLRRLAKSDPARAGDLLANAQRVLAALPHPGITRPVLAAQYLGDSHGLDPSQPVATLVLRAIALRQSGETENRRQVSTQPRSAIERHVLWDSAGVYENDLTRSVLTLNLRANDNGLVAQTLALHVEHGQPCSITLRQLIHHTPALTKGTVYLCENPAILAVAARRLGRNCPPMVCVGGQPGSATHQLLDLLKDANCTLRYHGDFDWAGIRIANQIIQTYDAQPWQMAEHDYAQAIHSATLRLKKLAVAACWAPELSDRMQQEGLAIHEEMLIENLLEDLGP